ncbi:MAG: 3-methyladenine DNA glycosylase [Balneolales bacterium]|nr:3-methyladenine DNA glycosylase [Balneolales bacterium]
MSLTIQDTYKDLSQENPLDFAEWQIRYEEHSSLIASLTNNYLKEKSHQKPDPVMDFMFTYYNYSPSKLTRWSPGYAVRLCDAASFRESHFTVKEFVPDGKDLLLSPEYMPARKLRLMEWTLHLMETVQQRQPHLNCCGMHEWAMVYDPADARHQTFPLRLKPAEIKKLIDSKPVSCTHFDAYRFFSESAKPKNAHSLSREEVIKYEQPGCLHANMDLYKWMYKLTPWIPGEMLADGFKLAWEARVLDMKAGPYDLKSIGYDPVCIETEEGRREYKKRQSMLWQKGLKLRARLISHIKNLLPVIKEKRKAAHELTS